MDMKQLMDMANQMKSQLNEAQEQAGKATYSGEAGGGMVKVTMNGRTQVTQVKIDKAAVDPNDTELLEDLLRAAFNQASQQMANGLQNNLGNMAQSMGLNLSSLGLGGQGDSGDEK